MLEKEIERRLKKDVEAMGGLCLKLVCPGCTGVPDRLIILPGGQILFAELKRPGQTERPRQHYVQTRLREMGCTVFSAVNGPEALTQVLQECRRITHGRV